MRRFTIVVAVCAFVVSLPVSAITLDGASFTYATSTTVEVSATTATAGETMSVAAVVTGVHPPEGTVTFFDGATELATKTIQSAYINQTFSPGSHSLTARYNGSSTYEASTSDPKVIFMKTPTAISATATLSGGILTIDGHVTATIGSASPNGMMSVRNGATYYGTATLDGAGHATLQIPLPSGVEELNIQYLGNSEFGSSWAEVNISVLQTPMISIHNAVQNEDDGEVEVTVTLGGTAGHTVTVDYATSNSSAVAGEDYDAATGTLVFTAGETQKSVDVVLNPDSDPEDDEAFAMTLTNPTGGNIADSEALITILNDDDAFLLYSDLQYGAAGAAATGTPLLLDLRIPMEGGPFPVVVVIDALRWSQPDHHSELANFLPSRGYAVATIGFRAAPAGQFPAQIDDLKTAIAWLRTNAAQYQLDLKRMAVLGSGRAGGHLAAFAAVTERSALGIDAAIIGRGATNLNAIVANSCDGVADIAAFLGCTACLDITANASPLTHVSADDAPFLIFRSDADCGQSAALTNGLRAVHVDATMQDVPSDPPAEGTIDWSLPEVRQSVLQFLDAKVKQQVTGRGRAVRK